MGRRRQPGSQRKPPAPTVPVRPSAGLFILKAEICLHRPVGKASTRGCSCVGFWLPGQAQNSLEHLPGRTSARLRPRAREPVPLVPACRGCRPIQIRDGPSTLARLEAARWPKSPWETPGSEPSRCLPLRPWSRGRLSALPCHPTAQGCSEVITGLLGGRGGRWGCVGTASGDTDLGTGCVDTTDQDPTRVRLGSGF